jgi:hypothetical protein
MLASMKSLSKKYSIGDIIPFNNRWYLYLPFFGGGGGEAVYEYLSYRGDKSEKANAFLLIQLTPSAITNDLSTFLTSP